MLIVKCENNAIGYVYLLWGIDIFFLLNIILIIGKWLANCVSGAFAGFNIISDVGCQDHIGSILC